ncbi:MAG: putative membrane protein YhhN [Hyphomicrobiaceae bacterium]|jgi:uncharacterized membrane protein YhhN
MTGVWVILCGVAVAGLLVAEYFDSQAGKWATKPVAAAAFIAIAVAGRAWETPYGLAVLTGLVLSMGGDILLISRGASLAFQAGAASFLLGHVAYCAAFLLRGVDPQTVLLVGMAVGIVAVVILKWLGPLVPSEMRPLVVAYIAVISVMLSLAAGTFAGLGDVRILAGATLFYLSDLAVARDRFLRPEFSNRIWGLPLYFAGQVLIALSV